MSVKALVAKPSSRGALTGAALVKKINTLHADCERGLSRSLRIAMEVGDLLAEAKRQCKHGEWADWVEKNCHFSYRSARMYMQLAKNRAMVEQNGNGAVPFLTINQSKKLIAGPSRPKAPEAEAPTDMPDLEAGGIFAACGMVGEFFAVQQIEESGKNPGYWYCETWNLGDDQTIVTMRAIRLTSGNEEMRDAEWFEMATGAAFDGVPFVRRGPWKAFDRETAPIPLIDESVRFKAWMMLECGKADDFATALDIAQREAA